jgi:aldose sugar dehydrogenase
VTKTLFGLALLSGAILACAPATDEPASNAEPGGSPEFEEPAQRSNRNITRLYQENCANCHGDRGEGGGAGTKTLLTREKFDQRLDKPFFDAIKHGVPDMGMEAYGGSLTDEEIWGLVVHIRELQAAALRAREGSPRPTNGVYRTQRHGYRIETVVDRGLRTPWSLDFLPGGRMLVTNRPGTMGVIEGGRLTGEVSGLPESVEIGQGGLMEVAAHPDYAKNGWVYLSYSEPARDGRGGMTKIVRGKISFSGGGGRWHSQQTIWEADQRYYTRAGVHFGSKIVFDSNGHVWFTVGERGAMMQVQSNETPFGKTMRVLEDGRVPKDNPWQNNPAFSTGHRNQQGLAIDLEGNVWVTEHGPRGGDELNLIRKGANYGWPVVAFSINYSDTPFRTPWPSAGQNFAMPVYRWLPSSAASGLDVARGPAFPGWKGDLLAGGLAGQNIDRIRVKGGQLVEREEILHGLGRVRDVATAPDGTIYVVLNQPDKIIRLVQAD